MCAILCPFISIEKSFLRTCGERTGGLRMSVSLGLLDLTRDVGYVTTLGMVYMAGT